MKKPVDQIIFYLDMSCIFRKCYAATLELTFLMNSDVSSNGSKPYACRPKDVGMVSLPALPTK